MNASIIIPTLHSPIIGQTLDLLRHQILHFPCEYEILVVGQDKFGQVREEGNVKFLQTHSPMSPAKARNIGIQASQGEILLFLDADCLPCPNWLERHLAHYEESDVCVVGGGVAFFADKFWTICDNLATFYPYLATASSGAREQLPSLNLSMRRECIEKIGMFDERYPYPAGEDADLTTRLHRAGYTLYFDPYAIVFHQPSRRTLTSMCRHAFRFGQYSIKINPLYNPSILFRRPELLLIASPFLAAGVTLRILNDRLVRQHYWYMAPLFWAAKLMWCFGAASSLLFSNPAHKHLPPTGVGRDTPFLDHLRRS